MGKVLGGWRWIPFAVGLGIPAVYFLGRRGDILYLDGFMGNWLATVLGLIVGVPIALAISEWERQAQAREESERRERELSARRAVVLRLIAEELTYNATLLRKRARAKRLADLIRAEARPKDEMWEALSDGGELHCVGDLRLLAVISEAYYRVRARESFGERHWDVMMSSPKAAGAFNKPAVAKFATEKLSSADLDVVKRIDKALGAIRRASGAQGDSHGPQLAAGWSEWLVKEREPDA